MDINDILKGVENLATKPEEETNARVKVERNTVLRADLLEVNEDSGSEIIDWGSEVTQSKKRIVDDIDEDFSDIFNMDEGEEDISVDNMETEKEVKEDFMAGGLLFTEEIFEEEEDTVFENGSTEISDKDLEDKTDDSIDIKEIPMYDNRNKDEHKLDKEVKDIEKEVQEETDSISELLEVIKEQTSDTLEKAIKDIENSDNRDNDELVIEKREIEEEKDNKEDEESPNTEMRNRAIEIIKKDRSEKEQSILKDKLELDEITQEIAQARKEFSLNEEDVVEVSISEITDELLKECKEKIKVSSKGNNKHLEDLNVKENKLDLGDALQSLTFHIEKPVKLAKTARVIENRLLKQLVDTGDRFIVHEYTDPKLLNGEICVKESIYNKDSILPEEKEYVYYYKDIPKEFTGYRKPLLNFVEELKKGILESVVKSRTFEIDLKTEKENMDILTEEEMDTIVAFLLGSNLSYREENGKLLIYLEIE